MTCETGVSIRTYNYNGTGGTEIQTDPNKSQIGLTWAH